MFRARMEREGVLAPVPERRLRTGSRSVRLRTAEEREDQMGGKLLKMQEMKSLRAVRRVRAAMRSAIESLEGRRLLSTTLGAIADADVQDVAANAGTVNANFGADPHLRVDGDTTDHSEAYVTFDISGVSAVGSAILRLHGGQTATAVTPAGPNLLVGAFGVPTTNWVEGNGPHAALDTDTPPAGEIRWANRPSSAGGAVDAVQVTVDGDYY